MIDISNITALISNLRAQTQKDTITPENLGALLQALANLLHGTAEPKDLENLSEAMKGNGESITAIQTVLDAIVEKTARGTMYHAKGIIPPMIDLSQIDSVPGITTSAQMTKASFPVEYIVTHMGYPMGTLFIFGDSMGHAVTQVIVTHAQLDESGALSANHGQPLHIYFRRFNITTHHGAAGEWTPWQDFISPEKFASLSRNVLDLGSFETEEAALLAAKLTNVSADSSVTLIRFSWDGNKKNGFILQQVGSQVDQNICDTYQFYSYGGRCWYRLIQWYYAADDNGHKARDFYTATPWKLPFGNTLRYNTASQTLQLLGWKNEVVSEVSLPRSTSPFHFVTSVEMGGDGTLYVNGVNGAEEWDDTFGIREATTSLAGLMSAADKAELKRISDSFDWVYGKCSDMEDFSENIPTLQTAWNTGTEGSYIYSKPWANGADNSKTVLTVGSHVAQHGGKLKMRYIFWGGGSGAAYGNEVPVATATCDGAMSAADKALLDDLKKRVEALETKH